MGAETLHTMASLVKWSETSNCGACGWEAAEYNCRSYSSCDALPLLNNLLAFLVCFHPKARNSAKSSATK